MAIVREAAPAWAEDTSYVNYATSPSFNAPADSVIFVTGTHFNASGSPAVTNSGTALTWNLVTRISGTSNIGVWYAVVSSARTGMTVTFTPNAGAFSIPAVGVQVFSGLDLGTIHGPASTSSGSTSSPITLTSSYNSTVNDAHLFFAALDGDGNGAPTSSNATAITSLNGTSVDATNGHRGPFASSGSAMSVAVSKGGGSSSYSGWFAIVFELVPESSATSHDATATRATTATLSASAVRETFGAATRATTATLSASAVRETFGAATRATTATLSASAVREAVATATAATTATLSATADVSNPNSSATLATTATLSASATLDSSASSSLATTVSLSASANIATAHDATATRATTVSITATASLLPQSVGDPGTMRALDVVGATMVPAESGAATLRTVLVGFNTATMQAVLDDSASAPLLGVPVFTGPDDPVTLGLVALTTPHVWFHSGTVTVREG